VRIVFVNDGEGRASHPAFHAELAAQGFDQGCLSRAQRAFEGEHACLRESGQQCGSGLVGEFRKFQLKYGGHALGCRRVGAAGEGVNAV
jgi:hypothetical protein